MPRAFCYLMYISLKLIKRIFCKLFQETIYVSFKVFQKNEEIATFFPLEVKTNVDGNGHTLIMETHGRPRRRKLISTTIK